MKQVLVISDVPVFKVNAGNRKCIKEYCDVLKELGANVTMLLISNHNTDKNDIKETEIYFGKENFILYKSNFIEEVIHSVIVHFRKYVSKNHYRIDDLCHANILHFISKTTKKRHFDSVIVNYLYYSKILNYCNVKTKALFVHDDYIFNNIRSNRNYFTLTPNDEAKGLQRAPFIFAIQENEACLYNYLAPKSSILCVYSPFKFTKQEISNNKNFWLNALQAIFATAIMGVAVFFIIEKTSNNILQLALGSSVGIFIYAGILLLFRNSYFIDILRKMKSYIKK